MFYRSLIIIFIATALFSCGEKAKFSKKELTQQADAWKVMMEGHDRVMPKINDLYQASKTLEKIAENYMVAADDTHPRVMKAIKAMENADDAMMDWMADISENQLESLRKRDLNHTDLMAFIAKEQTNIDAVEKAIESSLDQAKALIQEKSDF